VRAERADVELVHGLVAIPSLSRDEGEAVEWLVARMAERGFRASVDDAGNAIGEIGAGPFNIALLGHIDTVPGEIPVHVEGDELIGRGAVDAKGPLAAFVAAATRPPEGVRVTVIGAVEEESPSSAGARYRAALAAPDWCVVGEPSGWDAVTVAYKGRLALHVTLSRPARHGAAPGPTIGEEALAIWERVHAGAATAISASRAFDRLDCRLEGIRAGSDDGMAERAELRIGYRLPPGADPRRIEREAGALIQGGAGDRDGTEVLVETVGMEDPVRTERTSPLARAFARAIVEAGGQTTFKEKSGTSDMNILVPAWGCPIVAYGPGDSRYDHTPLERLSLVDYARSILVLRGVLGRATKAII
jgi:LysW-gamma-L-lysine carboxypeptidase